MRRQDKGFRALGTVAEVAALALVYAGAGRLGLLSALPPGIASALWPPSGVALAALLLRGRGLWPGIFAGSVLLNFGVLHGPETAWPLALGVASAIALASTLQAVLGASLIERFVGARPLFSRASGVVQFVAIEIVSCLVAPTAGAMSLFLSGWISPSEFRETWVTWWLGDAVGTLVIAPFLLVWANRENLPRGRAALVEAIALFSILLVVSQWVFDLPFGSAAARSPMAYLFLPVILGISFRLGLHGTVTAILFTATMAAWATLEGGSQFTGPDRNASLLSVQLFTAVTAVMGLTLGAVLREWGRTLEHLRRSNDELERFARVASHDLREPLRTIGSQLSLLERKVAGKLTEPEAAHLRFALDGSQRLQRLIEALLDFSMPGTAAQRDEVACADLMVSVLAKLRVAIEETGAEVTFDPLPVVRGDGLQLERVFQNLVGNALKYRTERGKPVVHVSAEPQKEGWLFSVADNGIGIDPQDTRRIFDAFLRLHGQGKYPGSGLGLSLCRRIVEHHGGKIWVESVPQRGSKFFFTLPA